MILYDLYDIRSHGIVVYVNIKIVSHEKMILKIIRNKTQFTSNNDTINKYVLSIHV